MMNWLDTLWANMTMTTLWGNNMVQYLSAILLAIGSYLVLRVFRNRVIIYVKRRTKATRDKRDDVIVSSICEIPSYFYWMISLFVAVQSLSVSSEITMAVDALFVIIVLGQIAFAIKRIILALMTAGKDEEHVGGAKIMGFAHFLINAAIRLLILMLVLSNLGIAITPLLTSLGVAGIAIAFALQNILEDIFSSISIYVDKPFRIGDFVEVDGVSGTVEHIGIKTTRLRTIQGEEVVLANKHVINKNLHNYGKIQERNVRTTIGVTYETARATLEMIPGLIQKSVENVDHASFVRAHFVKFSSSSLDFEFMYSVDNKDYDLFLDVQQQVNLHIVELFAKHHIDMAFPTQTIYVRENSNLDKR